MAKREYILREEALSHPCANGKYDHKNASIDFILGHESYEEWLEALSAFTEQDIVKPYLEKLKAEISEMDLNKVAKNYEDRFYGFQNEILQMIDNLLSESEGKE